MVTDKIYGSLPSDWKYCTINDLVADNKADLQTGPFGTALKASEYTNFGTPVVAVKHIAANYLLYDDIPLVDDEVVERLSRYRLIEGDILFARKGAVERRAIVRSNEEGWLQGSDCIRLRFTSRDINPNFISYVLGTPQHISWITRNAQGATMPSLNQEILGRVPLPLPLLEEQRVIANFLGTLDDKIDANRRTNATLEATARAIFKSWFVDFDPVHAKARGEQPVGMDAETAALFPDSFEPSELGDIPRGWRVARLGEEFDVVMGQSPPSSTYNELGQGLPFYQGRKDFGFRFPELRVYCTEPTRIANAGDALVSVRAPIGDINMALTKCSIGRGVAAISHKSRAKSYTGASSGTGG